MYISYKIWIFISFILSYYIKYYTKANRPYIKTPCIKKLDNYLTNEDNLSFPSSHVVVTIMLSLYWVYIKYKNITRMRILLIMPYLVGLSRMILGVHDLIDIMGGLYFGNIFYYLSTKYYNIV